MTFSVAFNFEPPRDPDFTTLRIWESSAPEGEAWELIETVTEIGTYPDYISHYETNKAKVVGDWFAIEWVTDKGATTDLTNAIQGGTELLIGEVVSRMQLYDPSLDEKVAYREAEAAVEEIYGVDPYTVMLIGIKYNKIQGLVYYSLARAYIATLIVQEASGTNDDYIAGLVSQKTGGTSGSQTKLDLLKYLLDLANASLGKRFSVVATMNDVIIAGGLSESVTLDQSRLLIEKV